MRRCIDFSNFGMSPVSEEYLNQSRDLTHVNNKLRFPYSEQYGI